MPPQTGDVARLRIDTVAFGGDGVGRLENLVVFVPFSAPGDFVEVEIREARKRFLRGRVRRILEPSPERAEPPCPYFFRCGGCQYQHIDYAAQVRIKERQVSDLLERIGRFPSPPVRSAVPSPLAYGYRGKGEFHMETERDGSLRIGFMDVSGTRLVDIAACPLMDESINRQLAEARTLGSEPPADRLVLWSSPGGDGGRVVRSVKGREIEVPRDGFFQANLALTDDLVDAVVDLAAPGPRDRVLELYSGSGLFSLFLAPRCRALTGIEIDPEAVESARRNMARHGIGNVTLHAGDAGEVLERGLAGQAAEIVLLDPPRAGCEREVLERLVRVQPERIVYVSCDPSTLARDARMIADAGFVPAAFQPFDMFPQTKHIECVALFEAGSRGSGLGRETTFT